VLGRGERILGTGEGKRGVEIRQGVMQGLGGGGERGLTETQLCGFITEQVISLAGRGEGRNFTRGLFTSQRLGSNPELGSGDSRRYQGVGKGVEDSKDSTDWLLRMQTWGGVSSRSFTLENTGGTTGKDGNNWEREKS